MSKLDKGFEETLMLWAVVPFFAAPFAMIPRKAYGNTGDNARKITALCVSGFI